MDSAVNTRNSCPSEKLRYTDVFDDPNLPGVIEVTVTLKAVSVGTEIHIVQAGIPDAIPVEACYLGWQESLQNTWHGWWSRKSPAEPLAGTAEGLYPYW